MIKRSSFRNKNWIRPLILLICIMIITFIVFLGIRTNTEVQNIVQKQFTGQKLLLSKQIATGIENFLNERIINIEILAKDLSDASPDRILSTFKNVYNKTSGIYVLEFINESGTVTMGYPEENTPLGYKNENTSAVMEKVRKMNQTYVTKPLPLLEGGIGSFIWTPLYYGGEFKGMILAIIKISDISDRFLKENYDSSGIYMIDKDGKVLYDGSGKYQPGENYLDLSIDNNPSLQQIIKKQISGANGTGYYFEGNSSKKKLIVYSPVLWGGQNWSIAVTSSESEVETMIHSLYEKETVFIGAAVGFIILGSLLIIILLSNWNRSLELEVGRKTNELKNSNEMLKEVNKELRELDMLKSDFVSMVSHELKTPLTAMLTSSEFLLENDPPVNTRREMLVLIIRNIDRLKRMVNDLLDLSMIESRRIKYNKEPVDLRYIINTAVENIKKEAQDKSLTVNTIIPENLSSIHADKDKLIQVFLNLLSNAVKFSCMNGSVAIKAIEFEEIIEVHVKDNGVGIPANELDKIFDKFYQVDNTSTRSYGGSGIGLSIAKSIIEGHGGKITVESKLGHGSDFIVILNKL